MAVDKLVDSTKLDACLDAEADAIRAKTGGSADILFDFANNKGFADAIAAIPSGSGLPEGGNMSFSINNSSVAGDFVLNIPDKLFNAYGTLRNVSSATSQKYSAVVNCKSLVANADNANTYFAYESSAFDTIELNVLDAEYVDLRIGMFGHSSVKEIGGGPYSIGSVMSSNSYYNSFERTSSLKEIRFLEDSATANVIFNWSAVLSDETLVSLGNALSGAYTLTLHATPKARLSVITGSVSDGVFTADDNGAVTLLDFITNTKGWTVA